MKLPTGDRQLALVAAVVAVALAVVLALVAPPSQENPVPSSYSAESGGAKAAYLLLLESGYKVERWEQAPSELPKQAGATVILAEPRAFRSMEEDRQALRQFIAAGGRVVGTGMWAAFLLPDGEAMPRPQTMTGGWHSFQRLFPAKEAPAPRVTMEATYVWPANRGAYIPLYGPSAENAVAVKYRVGKGEVIWWSGATPLTNMGIREDGNLEFLLASVGEKNGTRVLWDEYFHGRRRAQAASQKYSPIRWGIWQGLVIFAAILLTFSRRSGPVRVPRAESRLSPLEFVETMGGLYQQAGAADVPVQVAYQRFRYLLTRRLGVALDTPVDHLARAVQERFRYHDARFEATLRACDEARFRPEMGKADALRLVQWLHDTAVELKLIRNRKEDKH